MCGRFPDPATTGTHTNFINIDLFILNFVKFYSLKKNELYWMLRKNKKKEKFNIYEEFSIQKIKLCTLNLL